MNMEGTRIAVTHFINPSLFWYNHLTVASKSYAQIKDLEQQLEKFCRSKGSMYRRRPKEGEIHVVHYLPWNRYIRAEIITIAEFLHTREYVMWAIDHGFPFQTTIDLMRNLPDEYSQPIEHIKRGGLADVIPADKVYDVLIHRFAVKPVEKWNQYFCDEMERNFIKADCIVFREKYCSSNGHVWGDLTIVKGAKSYSARKYLLSAQKAIEPKLDFRKICVSLEAAQIKPYLSNGGNTKLKAETYGDHMQALSGESAEENYLRVAEWCVQSETATQINAVENVSSIKLDDAATIKSVLPSDSEDISDDAAEIKAVFGAGSTDDASDDDFNDGYDDCDQLLQTFDQLSTLKGTQTASAGRKSTMNLAGSKKTPSTSSFVAANQQNASSSKIAASPASDRPAINKTKHSDPKDMCTLPAGFDLAKLQKYKNESNHWHRKKSCLDDKVTHDNEMESNFMVTKKNPGVAPLVLKVGGDTQQSMMSSSRVSKTKPSDLENTCIVAAGFDLARLQKYNDDSNHWHRKKSTLDDKMQQRDEFNAILVNDNTDVEDSFSSCDTGLQESKMDQITDGSSFKETSCNDDEQSDETAQTIDEIINAKNAEETLSNCGTTDQRKSLVRKSINYTLLVETSSNDSEEHYETAQTIDEMFNTADIRSNRFTN